MKSTNLSSLIVSKLKEMDKGLNLFFFLRNKGTFTPSLNVET